MSLQTKVKALDHPCLLVPPIAGRPCLIVDEGLHRATREYVLRHELGHFFAGDAEEPTLFHFTGALPEAEYVADLFAFADLISVADVEQGEEWIAHRMRELVVLEYEPWYLRTRELPAMLVRLRTLIDGMEEE